MGKRKSLYLGEVAEAVVNQASEKGDSFSGRLNSIIVRYAGMVDAAMPALTLPEWLAVCDANNGTFLEVEAIKFDPARSAWLNVADSGPDGLAEKWGVNLEDLAQKLRAMSYPEQVAVWEIIQRFWRGNHKGDFADTFAAIGAKISADQIPHEEDENR